MNSKIKKFFERVYAKKDIFSIIMIMFLFLQTSSYSKLTGGGMLSPVIDQINEWRQDLFVAGCVMLVIGIMLAVIGSVMDANVGQILNKVIIAMIVIAVVVFIPSAIEMAGGATLNYKTLEITKDMGENL